MVDDLFKISNCGTESIKANAKIEAKIEMKNLRFGVDHVKKEAPKCQHLHVGKTSGYCPELKVHNVSMKKVSEAKYLGDIVSANGSIMKNIEMRANKGLGIISQIMSMINELSLGKHYFTIAILLRNLLFINSIMVNSEVWLPLH